MMIRRLLLPLALLFSFSLVAQNIWLGSNSSSWSDPLNWSRGTVPIASEDVVMGVAVPCNVDASVTVQSLSFPVGQGGGDLRQQPGNTITINGNLDMLEGSFQGNDADIIVNGDVTLNGGVLSCPSAKFSFGGSFTDNAGVLNPNQGTFAYEGGSSGDTLKLYPGTVLWNFRMDGASSVALYLPDQDTLMVENKIEFIDGRLNQPAAGKSWVACYDTVIRGAVYDQGNAPLIFLGDRTGHFLWESASTCQSEIYIEKDAAFREVIFEKLNVNSDPYGVFSDTLFVERGRLRFGNDSIVELEFGLVHIGSEGSVEQAITETRFGGSLHIGQGGRYDAPNSLTTFYGNAKELDVDNRQVFYNLTIDATSSTSRIVGIDDTLEVLNRLHLKDGRLNSVVNEKSYVLARDTVIRGPVYDEGTTILKFIGSTDGHFIIENDPTAQNNIYIEKDNPTDTVLFEYRDQATIFGHSDDTLFVNGGVVNFQKDSIVRLEYGEVRLAPSTTLIAPDDFRIMSDIVIESGALLKTGTSTITLYGNGKSIDVDAELWFENLIVDMNSSTSRTLAEGDTLKVRNRLRFEDGRLQGTNDNSFVFVYDTVVRGAVYDVGDAILELRGNKTNHVIWEQSLTFQKNMYVFKDNPTDTVQFIYDGVASIFGTTNDTLFLDRGVLTFPIDSNVAIDYGEVRISGESTVEMPVEKLTLQSDLVIEPAGTFHHNNADLHLVGSARLIDVDRELELYDLTIDMNSSTNRVLAEGDTLKILNKLDLADGRIQGVNLNSYVFAYDSVSKSGVYDQGDAVLKFKGSENGHFLWDGNSSAQNNLYIEKDDRSDTVFFETIGVTSVLGQLTDTLFINTGTVSFHKDSTVQFSFDDIVIAAEGRLDALKKLTTVESDLWVNPGGEISHNNGEFRFVGTSRYVDVDNSLWLYDLTVDGASSTNRTMFAGDTLHVINKLNLQDGRLQGTNDSSFVYAYDSVYKVNGYDQGNAMLVFAGDQTGHLITESNGSIQRGMIIDKDSPSDSVLVKLENVSATTVGQASDTLIVRQGGLHFLDSTIAIGYETVILEDSAHLFGALGTLSFNNSFNADRGNIHPRGGEFKYTGNTDFFDANDQDTLGNFTLAGTTSTNLDLSGDTVIVGGLLNLVNGRAVNGCFRVLGDVNFGTGYDGSGQSCIIFSGEADQTLTAGNTSIINANVAIDKPDGTVTLSGETILDQNNQTLDLIDGVLVVDSISSLTLQGDILVSFDSGYVDGPIFKTGADSVVIPVGADGWSAAVALSSISTPLTYSAKYFRENPVNAGTNTSSLGAGIDHVSQCEYWIINRPLNSDQVRVSLTFDSVRSCGIDAPEDLLVVQWDGSQWVNFGQADTNMSFVLSADSLNQFGIFTLASSTANNPMVAGFAVDLGPDLDLCDSLILAQNILSPDSILWSTGDSTMNLVVRDTGWYWVYVEDGPLNGMDSLYVSFLHDLQANNDTVFVTLGQQLNVFPLVNDSLDGFSQFSVAGQSHEEGEFVVAGNMADYRPIKDTTGTFVVDYVIEDSCGRTDSASIVITINRDAQFTNGLDLGADLDVCDSIQLGTQVFQADSVLWSTGSSDDSIWIFDPGVYTVWVQKNGLIERDTIVIGGDLVLAEDSGVVTVQGSDTLMFVDSSVAASVMSSIILTVPSFGTVVLVDSVSMEYTSSVSVEFTDSIWVEVTNVCNRVDTMLYVVRENNSAPKIDSTLFDNVNQEVKEIVIDLYDIASDPDGQELFVENVEFLNTNLVGQSFSFSEGDSTFHIDYRGIVGHFTGDDSLEIVVCDVFDDCDTAVFRISNLNIDNTIVEVTKTDKVVVTVTNVISRNGDDLNDFLSLTFTLEDDFGEISEVNLENRLRVFDRYGGIVWDSDKGLVEVNGEMIEGYRNDYNRFEGYRNVGNSSDPLPEGTYYYVLEYNTTNGVLFKRKFVNGFIFMTVED